MTKERGKLTTEVQEVFQAEFGRETTVMELRLLPYLQFCLMNKQNIDPNKVNSEERSVLSMWRKAGFIEGGASDLSVNPEFWRKMNEVLLAAYVPTTG